jgi:tol-pal system protein YbgF
LPKRPDKLNFSTGTKLRQKKAWRLRDKNPTEIRRCVFAALLGAGVLAAAGAARAQDNDIRPLLDRIDRLERDVNMLQRQVYRGTSPSGVPVPVSPPDAPSALGSDVRIDQMEDQMRTLTGQIEEVNYAIDQLKHRLDTLSSDVDQRFQMLGQGAPPGGPNEAEAPPPPPSGHAPPAGARANPGLATTAGADAGSAGTGAQPGILGTLRQSPDHGSAPPDAATPAALGSGSAQDQYNAAFGLLRRADYPDAERALRAFIQHYPNDALSGNAQYWLGETYFVRKDYEDAATAFAVGYQKYPHSGKAADNLLKLGMSLGNLGKKSEACSAFTRLDRDFPTAPPNVKDRATSERHQIGC